MADADAGLNVDLMVRTVFRRGRSAFTYTYTCTYTCTYTYAYAYTYAYTYSYTYTFLLILDLTVRMGPKRLRFFATDLWKTIENA